MGNLQQEYCESNRCWEESVHCIHSQVSWKTQQTAQCRAPGEPVMPNWVAVDGKGNDVRCGGLPPVCLDDLLKLECIWIDFESQAI